MGRAWGLPFDKLRVSGRRGIGPTFRAPISGRLRVAHFANGLRDACFPIRLDPLIREAVAGPGSQ